MSEHDQSWSRGAATWVPEMADEIDPDAPVAYVLTREGEVAAAGIVVPEPEAGS
jgi:hypothetical protein